MTPYPKLIMSDLSVYDVTAVIPEVVFSADLTPMPDRS